MQLSNVLPMLLGAALVAIGVLAAALADRIRGIHNIRTACAPRTTIEVVEPEAAKPAKPERTRAPRDYWPEAQKPKAQAQDDGANDVIAALVGAGYKKPIATEATWACTQTERATIEDWTRAALRRCARGGMS